MNRIIKAVVGVNNRLEASVLLVGGLLLGLLILENFVQIMARLFVRAGADWTEEVIVTGITWLSVVPAFIVLRRNRHMRLELLHDSLPGKAREALDAVNALFALLTCVAYLIVSCLFVASQVSLGAATQTSLNTPSWIPALSIAVAAGFMVLTSVELVLRRFNKGKAEE